MLRYSVMIVALVAVALAVPGKPVVPSGNWQVDARHSDVQLSTDGTMDFGKKKTNLTIGFARAGGVVNLDADAAKSSFHFDFYPSTSAAPTVDHDGKVNIEWFANHANNTMVCFHSQSVQQTADGKLKATGTLGLIRVDRNVELVGNEGYSGPTYGAPILHHVTHPATFEFEVQGAPDKNGAVRISGSGSLAREEFPALLKAMIATSWPTLVQDKTCKTGEASEAYAGAQCTGTFLAPSFPLGPNASFGEDYPGPRNYDTITGEHLTIAAHLRLKPAGSGGKASGGN